MVFVRRIEDREESHRMLNAVFKYMPAGITITAGPPDFRIRAVSDYAIRTIGIPREKLIGVPAGKHQISGVSVFRTGQGRALRICPFIGL